MSEIPLTEGPQDIAGLQRQINELKRQINALGGSISVTDGSTTVSPTTSLDFIAGASVGDGGGGIAQVSVSGGGGSPGSPINSVQFNSAASFGGTNLSYDGSGFSSPFVSTYSSASALGAAIANAGSGGTDGATVLTVVGGTGTPPQFNATITGGVLVSIDSVAVAGDMSVVPADPVAVTSSDTGPLTGATLNFGDTWSFAPAIIVDALGNGRNPALLLDGISGGMRNKNTYLKISAGDDDAVVLSIAGFDDGNGMHFRTQNGSNFKFESFDGSRVIFDMVDNGGTGIEIVSDVSAPLIVAYAATSLAFGISDQIHRLVIDSSGNTNIENGVLTLNPDGSNAGLTVATLPASPVLGMMTFVHDALAPVVGSAVAGTGSAKALVWWNGAQWTVIGI